MTDSTEGVQPRPPEAWDNPAWVRALMLTPDDLGMLEHVRAGHETLPCAPDSRAGRGYVKSFQDSTKAGTYAGLALAALYALECAGWDLPRQPSRDVVERFVRLWAQYVNETLPVRFPAGKRAVPQACWGGPREVAHLWATEWLLTSPYLVQAYPPPEGVLFNPVWLKKMLGVARRVQEFATLWVAPRSARVRKGVKVRKPAGLLGPRPLLVPDAVPAAPIIWAPNLRDPLLLKALESPRDRAR
jgi:hypothetical protein